MKNKDKYDLRRLDIIDCKRSSILDSHINSIEIDYDGRLVRRITYATASGLKKIMEWLEEEYYEK